MQRLFIAFLLCLQLPLQAQEPNDILLKINDEDITVNEFRRVYEKNLNLVEEDGQRDPKAYLDLFIDYKLKVQEAYALDLDKSESYQKELASYRKQLIKSHLTDVQVTEELVKEAYDRTREERRGQHILVRVTPAALPEDTLVAYNKINTARERIVAGEDFTKVAKEVSEDPSAQKNGGDLGYFKAFKMVYPFESAAYNTAVGKVSQPFRTRFGYHIVQPTDSRLSRGTITVAHIIISNKQSDTTINPELKIKEVYAKLENGVSFEILAENYSDDKNSASKGGELSPIEKGQLSLPVFEAKAFALEEIGTYTMPFETKYGWHIVKLLAKEPVPAYDELKKALQEKILRDSRSQVIDDNLNQKLRKQFDIDNISEIESFFKDVIPNEYKTAAVNIASAKRSSVAITIGDEAVTYGDFEKHLTGRAKMINYPSKDAFIEDQVSKFINKKVRSYYEEHLEIIDPEFNAVVREYKEGLLLFDLLESQIWEKAKSDSLGLKNFFTNNKQQFKSDAQIDVVIVTSSNAKLAKKAKKVLLKATTSDEIEKQIRDVSEELIVVRKKINVSELTEDVDISEGSLSRVENNDNIILYNVLGYFPSQERSLDEVQGLVTSAFQKAIEDNFVANLRAKASVEINEEVLRSLEENYND